MRVIALAQGFVIADIITGAVLTLNILVIVTSDPFTLSTGCLNIVCTGHLWLSNHGARMKLCLLREASLWIFLIDNTRANFDSSTWLEVFRFTLAIEASAKDFFIEDI